MSHEIIPTQNLRIGRGVGLAIAAATLTTLLGIFMLMLYVVTALLYYDSPDNCLGTPTLLWVLGLSMLAGMLTVAIALARAWARRWQVDLRIALTLTTLLLMPALVVGLFLIPAVNDSMIETLCYG